MRLFARTCVMCTMPAGKMPRAAPAPAPAPGEVPGSPPAKAGQRCSSVQLASSPTSPVGAADETRPPREICALGLEQMQGPILKVGGENLRVDEGGVEEEEDEDEDEEADRVLDREAVKKQARTFVKKKQTASRKGRGKAG